MSHISPCFLIFTQKSIIFKGKTSAHCLNYIKILPHTAAAQIWPLNRLLKYISSLPNRPAVRELTTDLGTNK